MMGRDGFKPWCIGGAWCIGPRRAPRHVVGLGMLLLATGCGPERSSSRDPAPVTGVSAAARTGAQIYAEYCAVCHMPDGGGVPKFQPALRGNAIVTGDRAKLEAVIRAGSAALRDREPLYAAEMPPFGMLTDEEVKATIDYLRKQFGAAEAGGGP